MRTLTPILFLVVAGCFGANAKQGEPKKGEKVAETKEVKIVRPGQPVVYDGVKVELVNFNQEKHFIYAKAQRVVIVKLSNLTESKIINFKSWAKDELSIVSDEFDNKYKMLPYPPTFNKRIDPNFNHEEPFFFEAPQKAAKEITLILRGENIGSKETVVCKFPTSFIAHPK